MNMLFRWKLLFSVAFICDAAVIGDVAAKHNNEVVKEPDWQILTRSNFLSQIRKHEFVLVMTTVPWSGEARSLKNDVLKLLKGAYKHVSMINLMLVYRNTEKRLGDMLGRDKAVNLIFYRHSVPYKYNGKLSAPNILEAVWHLMSLSASDLPFKRLITIEDLEFFLQSTDKAILLLDHCGWGRTVSKLVNSTMESMEKSSKDNHLIREKNHRKKPNLEWNSGNQIQTMNSMIHADSEEKKTLTGSVLLMGEEDNLLNAQGQCTYDAAIAERFWKTSLIGGAHDNDAMQTLSNTSSSNQQITDDLANDTSLHGMSCLWDDYNHFKQLYSNILTFARDNMLPPQRQRFGILANRSLISALTSGSKHKSFLMLHFLDCPSCTRFFSAEVDLVDFLSTSHPFVTELRGEGYKLLPALPSVSASLIVFIDRSSSSDIVRKKSENALRVVRQVAYESFAQGHAQSKPVMKSAIVNKSRKKNSLLSNSWNLQAVESPTLMEQLGSADNNIINVRTVEKDVQLIEFKGISALNINNFKVGKPSPQQTSQQNALGHLAKRAGLQILSGEFPYDRKHLTEITEILASLIKTANAKERDLKDPVTVEDLEQGDQQDRLGNNAVGNQGFFLATQKVDFKNTINAEEGVHNVEIMTQGINNPEMCERVPKHPFGSLNVNYQPFCKDQVYDACPFTKTETSNMQFDSKETIPAKSSLADQAKIPQTEIKEKNQDESFVHSISFYYTEEADGLLNLLSSNSSIPSVVIVDPMKQNHYIFPRDKPITPFHLHGFIDSYLNGTIVEYKKSEPFPRNRRESVRAPFKNKDFHSDDSIPIVTTSSFSRLVIGYEYCNKFVPCHVDTGQYGSAWKKDVLVLFSNDWCGYCKRMDMVIQEMQHCMKQIAPHIQPGGISHNSSPVAENSPVAITKGETKEKPAKNEFPIQLPLIFRMDCTKNDCSQIFRVLNQEELYPSLLLFPAEMKNNPIAYNGDASVQNILEFLAFHGQKSDFLYKLKGILWDEKAQESL